MIMTIGMVKEFHNDPGMDKHLFIKHNLEIFTLRQRTMQLSLQPYSTKINGMRRFRTYFRVNYVLKLTLEST